MYFNPITEKYKIVRDQYYYLVQNNECAGVAYGTFLLDLPEHYVLLFTEKGWLVTETKPNFSLEDMMDL